MKKAFTIIAMVALVAAVALASGVYDFEDYAANTIILTNNTPNVVTIDNISITYDSAHQTNTISVYKTVGGVDFLMAEEAGVDVQYDVETDDIVIQPGQVYKFISSTTSNVNILVDDNQ